MFFFLPKFELRSSSSTMHNHHHLAQREKTPEPKTVVLRRRIWFDQSKRSPAVVIDWRWRSSDIYIGIWDQRRFARFDVIAWKSVDVVWKIRRRTGAGVISG